MKNLAKEINNINRGKGFWNSMENTLKVLDTIEGSNFLRKQTKDAYITQKLALVHTEISEAVESTRLKGYEENNYGLFTKDSFIDELADTIIRILDICGELDLDIESQIRWKLSKNKDRPFMHNKNS